MTKMIYRALLVAVVCALPSFGSDQLCWFAGAPYNEGQNHGASSMHHKKSQSKQKPKVFPNPTCGVQELQNTWFSLNAVNNNEGKCQICKDPNHWEDTDSDDCKKSQKCKADGSWGPPEQ